MHSIYYVCIFCYWIDGKNQNCRCKIKLRTKIRIYPKCRETKVYLHLAKKERGSFVKQREWWESYLSTNVDGVPPAAPDLCPCLPTPFISLIPTLIWTSGMTLLTIIDPFFELSVIIPFFFRFFYWNFKVSKHSNLSNTIISVINRDWE